MHVKEILVDLMLVGAAALELTGCDSFWRFFRDARGAWWLLLGVGAFAGYGFVQTLQPLNFGRVYAMYGGIFVVMSIVWGAVKVGKSPHAAECVGGLLCVIGSLVIRFWPR